MAREINDEMLNDTSGGLETAFICVDTYLALGLTSHGYGYHCDSYVHNAPPRYVEDPTDPEGCENCIYGALVFNDEKEEIACFLKK